MHTGLINEFFAVVIAPELKHLSTLNIQLNQLKVHPNELEMLKRDQVDIVQIFFPPVVSGINATPLFKGHYCLVGHSKYKNQIDHNKNQILKALWSCPWVAYDDSLLFIKDYCLQVFDSTFEGKVAYQLPDLWSIISAVEQGAGISVLPYYFCQQYLKDHKISLLYKAPKPPTVTSYLAWRDGATSNPAIANTIKFIVEAARKKSLDF